MLASYFPVTVSSSSGLAARCAVYPARHDFLGPKHHYAEKKALGECGSEAF